MTVEDIVNEIPDGQQHVTISGGEPLLQTKGLLSLVKALRQEGIGVILFSGFYLNEIHKVPEGKEILSYIDCLIDGRFEQDNTAQTGVRGSRNQTIHLFSNRYTHDQLEKREIEFLFKEDGEVIITGFPDEELITALK